MCCIYNGDGYRRWAYFYKGKDPNSISKLVTESIKVFKTDEITRIWNYFAVRCKPYKVIINATFWKRINVRKLYADSKK